MPRQHHFQFVTNQAQLDAAKASINSIFGHLISDIKVLDLGLFAGGPERTVKLSYVLNENAELSVKLVADHLKSTYKYHLKEFGSN